MKKPPFRIHNLQLHSSKGWTWGIIFDPGRRQTEFFYATNQDGKGLWGSRTIVREPQETSGKVRLIRSPEEFSLPSQRQGAIQVINSFFRKLHEEALAKEAADKLAKEGQNVQDKERNPAQI